MEITEWKSKPLPLLFNSCFFFPSWVLQKSDASFYRWWWWWYPNANNNSLSVICLHKGDNLHCGFMSFATPVCQPNWCGRIINIICSRRIEFLIVPACKWVWHSLSTPGLHSIVEPVRPCLLQFICYCGWQQRGLTIQTAGLDITDPTWKPCRETLVHVGFFWDNLYKPCDLSKSRNGISDPFKIHPQAWITDSLPREWMMSESNEASSQCECDKNQNPAFFFKKKRKGKEIFWQNIFIFTFHHLDDLSLKKDKNPLTELFLSNKIMSLKCKFNFT